MPARTASNSSLFSSGEHGTTSPAPVTTSNSRQLSACVPYFQEATPRPAVESVPPTPVSRLLVNTSGESCFSPSLPTSVRHLIPACTSAEPAGSSRAFNWSRELVSSTIWSERDCPVWEWPEPRVATASECWAANFIRRATSCEEAGRTTACGFLVMMRPKSVATAWREASSVSTCPDISLARSAVQVIHSPCAG